MAKRTPDAKLWFGITTGGVVAVVTGLLTHFGFKLSPEEVTFLTAGVGLLGNAVGTYVAPYEPRVEEIVAEAEKIWNELHQA